MTANVLPANRFDVSVNSVDKSINDLSSVNSRYLYRSMLTMLRSPRFPEVVLVRTIESVMGERHDH